MKLLYPGYDVLAKRDSESWNPASRQVVDARLRLNEDYQPQLLDAHQWRTLKAVCARIVPQPADRPPVPVAAMVEMKIAANHGDGYRDIRLPPLQQAWRRGLAALDVEAETRHGRPFAELSAAEQDALLKAMQADELKHPAWGRMPAAAFFAHRVVHDIATAYYAHPTAWNEIGFGGPAGPRGYVRLGENTRDPWEPALAHPGQEDHALELNRRVR